MFGAAANDAVGCACDALAVAPSSAAEALNCRKQFLPGHRLPYTPDRVAQSKQQIQSLLSDAGSQPRHRFGQNFMIDQNLVRLVADAGGLEAQDLAIEVGPGTGTLTDELLARAGAVVAVEIDRDLAAMLRRRFEAEPRLSLIEGDALAGKHGINADLAARIASARAAGQAAKLVANLPYNIASPLVIELLIAGVETLAFTVQKEVADRLRAKAGDDAYGPLTVVAQMLADVQVLRTLPPQAFWPAPTIDSALVRMTRRDRLGDRARAFGQFVHAIFSFRRKTLRRALAQADLDAEKILAATSIDGQARPEVLTPEQVWAMFEAAR
jgi:16S rRNA (adenine1518-N6/adenine1519-N6)-dimethyltransferase